MRLGVLDVGSNTVHLLVVDAHRGAHPTPMTSEKAMLRLAERIGDSHVLAEQDADELIRTVAAAKESSVRLECAELIGFATSAIREASNADTVLRRVREATGVELQVLSGEDEARYTFLAARRWYGWSAGRLLLADIGGGSLEMALGVDEDPDLALSSPLGAGRVARSAGLDDPPTRQQVKELREWLDEQLAVSARRLRDIGEPNRTVATSKTFRSLARLTGALPSTGNATMHTTLTDRGLGQLIEFISRISSEDLATLRGVSSARSHQLVSGALIAEAVMRAMKLSELDICPWALREGVILRRLDHTNGEVHTASTTEDLDDELVAGHGGRQ